MDLLGDVLRYVADNPDKLREAVAVHLRLSVTALLAAVLIFVPLGALVSLSARVGPTVVGVVAALRVVPSLAVLVLLYYWTRLDFELLGFTVSTAVVALALLAGPPLVINTDAGLRNVSVAVLENARGLGMTPLQVFARVQFPLALPVVLAGVRTATVEVIASATLGAFVGTGGFGTFITAGLTLIDYRLLLVGAIPVTILALLAEALLALAERSVAPPTG